MRTIDDILKHIITEKVARTELDGLNSTSKTAIWHLWSHITAVAIWLHEKVFVQHKIEVEDLILKDKSHTILWYRTKAKAFQYGFNLLNDSDQFDNTGYSQDQIENSKIIKYVAVSESDTESRLIIKIATETGGLLAPITAGQKLAFEAYLKEIKDAGVRTTVINYLPDQLRFVIQIKRDANILDQNGNSIIFGNNPVKEAINTYMKELSFDGELVLNKLIDVMQTVNGVINPTIMRIESSWIDSNLGKYGVFESIAISKIPVSGYFEIDWQNSIVNYVV